MQLNDQRLQILRQKITESLRIQRDSREAVPYIDASNVLGDVCSRQNHAIFARRGCGKTLLLHHSSRRLDEQNEHIRTVYLNCEDFKHHSFPNVLIEIVDALFYELETHLTGWFGRKRRSRDLIREIRLNLSTLKAAEDTSDETVRHVTSSERASSLAGSLGVGRKVAVDARIGGSNSIKNRAETERTFTRHEDKIRALDMQLPRLKQLVREFFNRSSSVQSVFLQIDDFYHLRKTDQPYIIDYIHRLCKDLPLYFKIATLRHASSLYVDRDGQPIGTQERHDYQPVDIDYTFTDFTRTRDQNRRIFYEFGKLASISKEDMDDLFKGQGFDRLVMAGGGVPRDTLSLFLEVLGTVQSQNGDRIGKDDVRILSRSNFERRIDELKQDSEGGEQDELMRGIYALRQFCLEKKSNVFMVSEQIIQRNERFRALINRLLDYRIIHNAGSALTHKSRTGTYQGFAIDIGCYAHLRKLQGRFNELDVSMRDAKEKLRSSPILEDKDLLQRLASVPGNIESELLKEDEAEIVE